MCACICICIWPKTSELKTLGHGLHISSFFRLLLLKRTRRGLHTRPQVLNGPMAVRMSNTISNRRKTPIKTSTMNSRNSFGAPAAYMAKDVEIKLVTSRETVDVPRPLAVEAICAGHGRRSRLTELGASAYNPSSHTRFEPARSGAGTSADKGRSGKKTLNHLQIHRRAVAPSF